MNRTDTSSALAAFDLAAAVRRQSWDWFYELRQRLNLAVEIVDERGALVLPSAGGRTSTIVGRLLGDIRHMPDASSPSSDVRALIAAAVQTRNPQTLSTDRLEIVCLPLGPGRVVSGALVLAKEVAWDDADQPRVDLVTTGRWLGDVIEAHLVSASTDDSDELQQVSSLHRVLSQAATNRSEREVLEAFVEAVAIWDDLEVRAYSQTLDGNFALDVLLAGSDRAEAPQTIDADAISGDSDTIIRLSPIDAERLGFRPRTAGTDIAIERFSPAGDTTWLLVFTGSIDVHDQARLALYCDLVRQTLKEAATLSTTRVTWSLMQPLLVAGDQVEAAAQEALEELKRAVRSAAAALVVTAPGGRHALSVGDVSAFAVGREVAPGQEIFSSLPLAADRTMVLALRRSIDQPFSRRDQRIVDAARQVFAAWLPGILRQSVQVKDRRARSISFEQMLERTADDHLSHGAGVAVLVLSVQDGALRDGWTNGWVSGIRAQLRPWDLAGSLSDTDIGILLPEATSEHACAVAERLCQRLDANGVTVDRASMSIGIASCTPDTWSDDSLVGAARDDARRRRSA